MYTIVHTSCCAAVAEKIASCLEESLTFDIQQVLENPEILGDFDCLGLVFDRQEKGVPSSVVSFINDVLGNNDLSGLQYMFSICVCEGGPAHALKIVEKLCSRVGCAPSLNATLPETEDVNRIVEKIRSGEIELAKGSVGTMFYMKTHGIKGRGQRR